MKKIICCLLPIACFLLPGCVGNKAEAEVTGLKIERKPSAAEEAQGWANAIKTLLPKGGNPDD